MKPKDFWLTVFAAFMLGVTFTVFTIMVALGVHVGRVPTNDDIKQAIGRAYEVNHE